MTARPPHLLVLVGIPGSGKSSYASRLQARCPGVCVISPDALRQQLYPGYEDGRVDVRHIDDHRIFQRAYAALAEALHAGRDVLFDATSLTRARRGKLLRLGRRAGAIITARYFPISLAEAFRRNRLRPRQVPPGAIAHMAKMLAPPDPSEGFDRVVVHRQ
ncbi:MAG: AAA family ATPase [Armatimonadota bacterium]